MIGSRYIKGGKNEMTLFRYLLSYFGNLFIKKIFILNVVSSLHLIGALI